MPTSAAVSQSNFTSEEQQFLAALASLDLQEGDLFFIQSGKLCRLPKGEDGQNLMMVNGYPSWK